MGFFTFWDGKLSELKLEKSRNPFQGGMGFFTQLWHLASTSPLSVAIPFRVGWGFSPDD